MDCLASAFPLGSDHCEMSPQNFFYARFPMSTFFRTNFSRRNAILIASLTLFLLSTVASSHAQNFVEYPNQNQTYGDHTLNSNWVGGPTGIEVSFDADGVTLHEDGDGFSQRTARNTQNFVSPASAANPQNFDNQAVVTPYGSRLPLIQQMSSDGTSVLTYRFDAPVNSPLDLFITDVDSSDFASIAAFNDQNERLDMRQWKLVDEGDLSVFKDTGTAFSSVVAPTPFTVFDVDEIRLTATNNTNYNRSYSILRNPIGQNLSRIEITFTGTRNSPSRANPNTGSHIYTALATAPVLLGDANGDGVVNNIDIASFALALFNRSGYLLQFPDTDPDVVLDMNNDGAINNLDISGFAAALGF